MLKIVKANANSRKVVRVGRHSQANSSKLKERKAEFTHEEKPSLRNKLNEDTTFAALLSKYKASQPAEEDKHDEKEDQVSEPIVQTEFEAAAETKISSNPSAVQSSAEHPMSPNSPGPVVPKERI